MERDNVHDLYSISSDGFLDYFFHDGQFSAWESTARFLLVLAGRQSGKTAFGPPWLYREIQRNGPGDYLTAAPTFKLLYIKAIPEIEAFFDRALHLGRYIQTPIQRFVFSKVGLQRTFGPGNHAPTTIYFGHGQDPESLEAATHKGIWLDEAGQKKFKLASWDAVQGRATTTLARILLTTTPYYLGWLKSKVFDLCGVDPDYELVRFESIANPNFSRKEWDRLQKYLPKWKFDLFYRALWTRPAGLIYDNFLDVDKIKRYRIPAEWPRYVGLDFGGVNTAALFYAWKPDTDPAEFIAYRTYHPREKKTIAQHVAAIRKGEPANIKAVGGAPSEGQWRREFKDAGLPVRRPPIKDDTSSCSAPIPIV